MEVKNEMVFGTVFGGIAGYKNEEFKVAGFIAVALGVIYFLVGLLTGTQIPSISSTLQSIFPALASITGFFTGINVGLTMIIGGILGFVVAIIETLIAYTVGKGLNVVYEEIV